MEGVICLFCRKNHAVLKLSMWLVILCIFYPMSISADDLSTRYKNAKTPYEKLKIIAEGINTMYPLMVNENLRVDMVMAAPNMEMVYMYTCVNHIKNEIVFDQDAVRQMKGQAINTIRSFPDAPFYKDNKVSFSYYYKDKDGVIAQVIKISADELWGEKSMLRNPTDPTVELNDIKMNSRNRITAKKETSKNGFGDWLHEEVRKNNSLLPDISDRNDGHTEFVDYDKMLDNEKRKNDLILMNKILIFTLVIAASIFLVYIFKIRNK